jgi:uncharacterized protein
MPQENIELHRRVVEAFNTRDVERFIAFCDPKIELHSAVTVPGGAVYHGHEGVRKWYRDLEDAFGSDVQLEPEAYYDLGEQTITFHLLHGRGRQSGAHIAERFAHLHRWRDGRIVHFQGFSRREEVLTELGLTEEALEPIAP